MRTLLLILVAFSISSFMVQEKPAKVRITVIDESNMVVQGAKVILYGSAEDYNKEQNGIISGTTNEKGYVMFKNLEPKAYYVYVEKGDLNNNGGNVQTGKLDSKGKSRFEILIN